MWPGLLHCAFGLLGDGAGYEFLPRAGESFERSGKEAGCVATSPVCSS